MWSRLYETVERPSVCLGLSVSLSHRSTAVTAAGGFAAERHDGMWTHRWIAALLTCCGRAADAVGQPFGASLSSKYGQRHVDSRRRKLNTDLSPT